MSEHLQAKVVSSVEALYLSISACRDVHSGQTALAVLTAEELDDLFQGRKVGTGAAKHWVSSYENASWALGKLEAIEKPLTGAEILFVGPDIWLVYSKLVQIYGRMGALLNESFRQKKYVDWRADELMLKEIRDVVSEERVEEALNAPTPSLYPVLVTLEWRFVQLAREIMNFTQPR